MYEFEIPTPPKWMGYSKDEVIEETKEIFEVGDVVLVKDTEW